MKEDTLTALSQRESAFWIALALIVVGSLVSNSGQIGDTLVALGMAIIAVRVLVAFYRIFRTSATAGKIGYKQGKRLD